MSENASNHILGRDDINHAAIECREIRAQWYTLGVYLGISIPTIQAIDVSNNNNVFGKLTDLVSKWIAREKKTSRPSWRALCKALEEMGNQGLAESIAKKHMMCNCKDCSGGNNAINPIAVQAVDCQLSNLEVAPGVSASNIFQEHFAHLARVMEADPIRFAGEFATVNLIPPTLVGNLNTRLGVTNLEKATELVTVLSSNLMVADGSKLLLKICEVLKKQRISVLDTIIEEILKQLGVSGTAPLSTTAVTAGDQSVFNSGAVPVSTAAVTRDTTNDIVLSKAAKIRSLLSDETSSNHVQRLEKAFDDDMKNIVEGLYKAEVISEGVKENPSYNAITKQFLNTLEFCDDDKELAEYCCKFLKVLISIPGPTKKCGEWIKKEIEKIGLEISLQ